MLCPVVSADGLLAASPGGHEGFGIGLLRFYLGCAECHKCLIGLISGKLFSVWIFATFLELNMSV